MRIINIPAQERAVFVCEKRHQSMMVARNWNRLRPDHEDTWFLSLNAVTGAFAPVPRDIPISATPLIREPVLERGTPHLFAARALGGELVRDQSDPDAILRSADHVVYACDADVRGAGMFREFVLTRLGRDCAQEPFLAYLAIGYNPEMADPPFSAGVRTTDPECRPAFMTAEARRFFNHNWALNALPLLGAAYRAAGGEGNAFISKYSLLLLYALRRFGPMTEGDILLMMAKWRGSGKYANGCEFSDVFGSASSRSQIIEDIRKRGLIGGVCAVKAPGGTAWRMGLTPLGRDFLGRLHPDCHDPDLGFRLWEWGRRWPDSRPAVERYLRTYFGKQKRFRGGEGSSQIVAS